MKIELFPPLSIHEVGMRDNQEDALWPKLPEKATEENSLYILCDGMGGHENGEIASRLVSISIPHFLLSTGGLYFSDDETLNKALDFAYRQLDYESQDKSKQMGTTLALLNIHDQGITAAHLGDSRIYHIRPNVGILYQSRDHSLAAELYQAGEITYEEMLNYPKKNIVTRAMMPGKDNRMHPDIIHITDILPGDYFYLCSDGMLEQMSNNQLVTILSSDITDEDKQRKLIESTKDNQDNHSAWIIHIKGVTKEDGDETLPNEESTSRYNMVLNIPVNDKKEDSDVVIVKEGKNTIFHKFKKIIGL